jgi:hypothetical protein
VNDISLSLNGAQYFSKLDLSQAYHQLELEEQSRYITTFSTHLGLYRYKRLNYGTNAVAEMFQYTLKQHYKDLLALRISRTILLYLAQHEASMTKILMHALHDLPRKDYD